MNFEPSETQQLLRETALRLARDRFAFQDRRDLFLADSDAIHDEWNSIAALGIPAILVPTEHGGAGGTLLDMAAVLEVFGGAMVIEAVAPTAVVGAGILARGGSAAQQAAWLPGLAAGEVRIALATAEAATRYDVATPATRCVGGALSGAKTLVQGGGSADLFVVSAVAEGGALALYLVRGDAPGLTVAPYRNLDLGDAADLTLDQVPIGEGMRLTGDAHALLGWATDAATAAASIEAVGAMQALHELTLEQLRTRRAFGRTLGGFQVLQHRLVDMIVATEQARSATLVALDRADRSDAVARGRAVSAAKVQVGRSARLVGEQAMQLHGAMAITLEHPVGYLAKKLAVLERLHGDVEHHLARYADLSGY